MKVIQIILGGLDKIQDVVRVVKAFLAGLETFTNELKKSEKASDEN
mgnify:CR=1 FL=1